MFIRRCKCACTARWHVVLCPCIHPFLFCQIGLKADIFGNFSRCPHRCGCQNLKVLLTLVAEWTEFNMFLFYRVETLNQREFKPCWFVRADPRCCALKQHSVHGLP